MDVLKSFLQISKQASSLGDLVRATRPDVVGPGPTLSKNENRLDLIDKVIKDQNLENHEILVSTDIGDKITASPYPMLTAFNEYGLQRPTNILSQWFPWLNIGFKEIKKQIQDNFPSRTLTPEELDLINFDLLGYIASGFEFFNQEYRDTVLFNFPKSLEKFKEDNPDLVERNSFLRKLVVTKATKKNGLPFDKIEFRNTGSMTNSERELYQADWEDLINTENFSKFGRNLVRYAYYTSGFHFTPNSFTHLIPTSFYVDLIDNQNKKFVDYLTEAIENTKYDSQVFDGFVDQFYKNSTGRERAGFVPTINSDKSNITGDVTTIKGVPIVFRVDANDINTTNEFVISNDKEKGAEFVPYVKYNLKGKTYLFKLQETNDPWQAAYVITEKLGLPNNMLELGMGVETSVPFTKNNPISNFTDTDLAKMNQAITAAQNVTSKTKKDENIEEVFTDEQKKENDEKAKKCKSTEGINKVEGISKQTRRKR